MLSELKNSNLVQKLEDLAHESWLAAEIQHMGGWLLRANRGVTRRANSVFPRGIPSIDLGSAVQECIRFYHSRSLIPRFQMTEVSQPAGLDIYLEELDWRIGLQVDVEIADIDIMLKNMNSYPVEIYPTPPKDWINAYLAAAQHSDKTPAVREQLMLRTPLKKVFAASRASGTIAGVGLGVLSGDWLGLFSIATMEEYRAHGIATAISQNIAAWGREHGASHVYLQVEANNSRAKRMYSHLGFNHFYKYWYRELLDDTE